MGRMCKGDLCRGARTGHDPAAGAGLAGGFKRLILSRAVKRAVRSIERYRPPDAHLLRDIGLDPADSEDEVFYVLSGEVLIEVEGWADPLPLGPGGFLFAPRNRRHAYRNVGTVAAHLLVFAIPGTDLERMFAAFDAAGKRTAHMPAIGTIAAIAEQYGGSAGRADKIDVLRVALRGGRAMPANSSTCCGVHSWAAICTMVDHALSDEGATFRAAASSRRVGRPAEGGPCAWTSSTAWSRSTWRSGFWNLSG